MEEENRRHIYSLWDLTPTHLRIYASLHHPNDLDAYRNLSFGLLFFRRLTFFSLSLVSHSRALYLIPTHLDRLIYIYTSTDMSHIWRHLIRTSAYTELMRCVEFIHEIFFNSQKSSKCETQKCWCSKYVADNSYEDIFFLGFSKSVGKKGMPKLCRVVMLWPNQYESVKLDFRWNERRKSHRHMCRIFNLALTWQCHTLPLPILSLLTFAGTYFDCDIPISLGNKWNARVG